MLFFLLKLNVSTESFRHPNTKSKAAFLAAALPVDFFLSAPWKEQKVRSTGLARG